MGYMVAIRKNSTGEIRMSEQRVDWDDGSVYWWTEGNMGCDCNRDAKFKRAGDEEEDRDAACGDSAYSALYAIVPLDDVKLAAGLLKGEDVDSPREDD